VTKSASIFITSANSPSSPEALQQDGLDLVRNGEQWTLLPPGVFAAASDDAGLVKRAEVVVKGSGQP
jgi:hypothetical protein